SRPTTRMRLFARQILVACSLAGMSGCLAPWNYRLPTWWTSSPEVGRIEQQFHDPHPDSQLGPDTGTRPQQYMQQRPLPVRIREKSDQARGQGQLVPPPVSPDIGSQYPAVVPF